MDLIGYPLAISTTIASAVVLDAGAPLTSALAPLNSAVPVIYAYDSRRPQEPWLVFGAVSGTTARKLVNTLGAFEYGQGYQVYATRPVTLLMTASASRGVATSNPSHPVVLNAPELQTPPAVFVSDQLSVKSPAGLVVTAAGVRCSNTRLAATGQNTQTIIIVHAGEGANARCFTAGTSLHFELKRIDGRRYTADAEWDNRRIQELNFTEERGTFGYESAVE